MKVCIRFLKASSLLAQATWVTLRAHFALSAPELHQPPPHPRQSGHLRLHLSRTLTLGLDRALLTSPSQPSGIRRSGASWLPLSRDELDSWKEGKGGGDQQSLMPSATDSQLNQSSFPSWVLDLLVSMGPFGKAHRPILSMFLSV